MSSPDREREKAALAELDKFCKEYNEVVQAETKRRAKIAWITREIERLDDGRLNRVVVTINQVKE